MFDQGCAGSHDADGIQIQGAMAHIVVFQLKAFAVFYVRSAVAFPPSRDARLYLVVER